MVHLTYDKVGLEEAITVDGLHLKKAQQKMK
jgi:hypothetical protein